MLLPGWRCLSVTARTVAAIVTTPASRGLRCTCVELDITVPPTTGPGGRTPRRVLSADGPRKGDHRDLGDHSRRRLREDGCSGGRSQFGVSVTGDPRPDWRHCVRVEGAASVDLLGHYPYLIPEVGLMRWREWGRAPEPTDPAFWVAVTGDEAGTAELPITWVAISSDGRGVGAVGLGRFDIEERRDRSPWVLGMVVDPSERRRGVGRLLLAALCGWAKGSDWPGVWVATGGAAVTSTKRAGGRFRSGSNAAPTRQPWSFRNVSDRAVVPSRAHSAKAFRGVRRPRSSG